MKYLLLFILLLFSPLQAHAYQNDLDGLFKDHVRQVTKNGITYNGIDYVAWGKDPRHAKVRDEILAVDPASLTSKNEKLAYWINAYNLLTIDLITREGEQDSIKNLGGTFSSPWEKHTWTIAGKEYTLDKIEHGIVRPMKEPRVHFALNCAAKSCPDLRAEAFRAERIEQQLDEQARKTFQNSAKGYKDEGNNVIRVSKVLDWFGEDFNGGDLRGWLKNYFPDVINNDTTIQFFEYDWSLNKAN